MMYGMQLLDLIHDELQKEEKRLKELTGNRPNIRSVREYFEGWLCYMVFRASLSNPDFVVWVEVEKIDLQFRVPNGPAPLATFEFSNPFGIKDARPDSGCRPSHLKKIVGDFKKQYSNCSRWPGCEHWVIMFPWGETDRIDSWLEKLKGRLDNDLPQGKFELHEKPPMVLNDGHRNLFVVGARIEPRLQSGGADFDQLPHPLSGILC